MIKIYGNKKFTTLFVILTLLFAYSTYVIAANTNQYAKILDTRANFDLKIDDMEIEKGPDNIVYFNTTMSAWNNGSTPLVIYQIQYSIYLNSVNSKNWVDSEGGFLYQGIGNIRLEPDESRTFAKEPIEHNLTKKGLESPISRNLDREDARWNWIVTSCHVKIFLPKMDAEDGAYDTREPFDSALFIQEIGGDDDSSR